MINDLTKIVESIAPQVISGNPSTNVEGTGVATELGHDILHIVQIGNSGDTLSGGVFIQIAIQESDALASGYAGMADAAQVVAHPDTPEVSVGFGASAGRFAFIDAPSEDTRAFGIFYRGTKAFSRVVVTAIGNHANGTPISAVSHITRLRSTQVVGS